MADRPRNRILPPTPEADDGIDDGGAHGSEDKLFIQLLDDLDNISGGSDQSIHRRRRAREIFSEWLFSQDVRNPQMMRLKAEQTSGRRHSGDVIDDGCRHQVRQQHSCDVEPFQREQSARRSCGGLNDGVQRRPGSARRPRPSSSHYPSENDIDPGYCTGSRALLAASVVGRPPSLEQTEKERNWLHLDLKRRIEAFNQNDQGLFMETSDEGCSFRGSIRIHMNLTNPISISAQPHFDFHRAPDAATPSQPSSASLTTTSFCLPKNTTKVIRISNFDSTQEVIRALLTKFNITDNPRKFVLYEKIKIQGKKASIRQISDSECPLVICLTWTDVGGTKTLETNKFILQENNSGENEILWKSFNLLELESFLSVLDREEAEHIDQVKTKYRKLKTEILKHLQLKQLPSSTSSRRHAPLFL